MAREISDLAENAGPAIMPGITFPYSTPHEADLGALVNNGYTIEIAPFEALDQDLIRQIIESGFGEKLVPHYFDGKADARFLVERDKRGVAVLLGDYLDILAVAKDHQSNGIGKSLIEASLELSGNMLYWRSRPERVDINKYYERLAHPVPFVSVDRINYNGYFVGYPQEEISQKLLRMVLKPSNFQ